MNERRKSLFGGYPHSGIKSQEAFKPQSRLYPELHEGKIGIRMDLAIYPNFPTGSNDTELKDFLLDRIADYDQALNIAEQQIRDIGAEYPFIPEDFGFELTEMRADTGPDRYNPPMYRKDNFVIARIEDHKWLLADAGSKLVDLPNAHIAYIVLRSLGVITDEEFAGDTEFSVNESDLSPEERENIAGIEDLAKRIEKAFGGPDAFTLSCKALWNDETQKFEVPATRFHPKRLWGYPCDREEFSYLITEEEFTELKALVAGVTLTPDQESDLVKIAETDPAHESHKPLKS